MSRRLMSLQKINSQVFTVVCCPGMSFLTWKCYTPFWHSSCSTILLCFLLGQLSFELSFVLGLWDSVGYFIFLVLFHANVATSLRDADIFSAPLFVLLWQHLLNASIWNKLRGKTKLTSVKELSLQLDSKY